MACIPSLEGLFFIAWKKPKKMQRRQTNSLMR